MSEPQQPPVPPSAQPNPTSPPAPPAPHLPAAPQYPAAAPHYPAAPQQHGSAPQHAAPQPPYGQQPTTPQPYTPQPHSQQQFGQEQFGQQQYGQQPYGQQAQPGSGSDSGNALARTAFIIALVVAAAGALQIVLQPFVLASFDYTADSFGAYNFFFGVILFFGSATTLVLGLIALRRPGGHALAGIAIGVGGIQLIGIVLGWISSLFYNLF